MEYLVCVVEDGRTVATFRVDPCPPLAFWRVEIPGRSPYASPMRVTGEERPSFFYRLFAAATVSRLQGPRGSQP